MPSGKAPLAQSVEHQTFNLRAAGSNPAGSTILASMAEWSKAEHLSCSLFGGAGSNPARCTLLGYSFFTGTILFQEFTQQFNFLYEEDGDLHKLPCLNSDRC